MKKSFVKKLALSKATVANLNKTEMNEAKGGNISGTCWTGDDCTYHCSDGDHCLSYVDCGTKTMCITYACTMLLDWC